MSICLYDIFRFILIGWSILYHYICNFLRFLLGFKINKEVNGTKEPAKDKDPKKVTQYCKNLINVDFYGCDTSVNDCLKHEVTDLKKNKWAKLALALKTMDAFIRKKKVEEINDEEEEFQHLLKDICDARDQTNGNDPKVKEKFLKDAKNFIKVYKQRGHESEAMDHDDYWADRQQLLSGKVIADFIDDEYGPMDPVFGVLLHPTTGRIGPGDTSFVHRLLFDDDGRFAYHGAVHDAFGYLVTEHNVGPGYNYPQGVDIFGTRNFMSGQLGGLHFWGKSLKELRDSDDCPYAVL